MPDVTQKDLSALKAAEARAESLRRKLVKDPEYVALVLAAIDATQKMEAFPAAVDVAGAEAEAQHLRSCIESRVKAGEKVEAGKHTVKLIEAWDFRCSWESVVEELLKIPEVSAAIKAANRACEVLGAAKARAYPGWSFVTRAKKAGHPKVEITFG